MRRQRSGRRGDRRGTRRRRHASACRRACFAVSHGHVNPAAGPSGRASLRAAQHLRLPRKRAAHRSTASAGACVRSAPLARQQGRRTVRERPVQVRERWAPHAQTRSAAVRSAALVHERSRTSGAAAVAAAARIAAGPGPAAGKMNTEGILAPAVGGGTVGGIVGLRRMTRTRRDRRFPGWEARRSRPGRTAPRYTAQAGVGHRMRPGIALLYGAGGACGMAV